MGIHSTFHLLHNVNNMNVDGDILLSHGESWTVTRKDCYKMAVDKSSRKW